MGVTRLLLLGPFYYIQTNFSILFCTRLYLTNTVFIGYKWSAWSSYSPCSESCASCSEQYCIGTRYRTRKCGNVPNPAQLCLSDPNKVAKVTDYKQTRSCKTVDCCKANDKFKCDDGKCIGLALNKQSVKNKWVNRETVI